MILVEVDLPEKLTIANIYIPPQLSCAPTLASSLLPILLRDSIVGDVNGHNDLWSAGANDVRGDSFVDKIDSSILRNSDLFRSFISKKGILYSVSVHICVVSSHFQTRNIL